ncbi:MAG: hypothetical protein UV82_C0016G0028 [Candidatus Magasanikbacteria bacterium GW2011_GWD2_43_18]|uniref:Uncharacterized protein n=1 Tax=Candidatus Magasanikbacteria bacterium GW2011_GWE2_42_7 TaxID=1619052 RepID=A0A0G1DLP5_9BACT|nr:MAG: hypothetical protein UV18_C0004G0055 [Candidatus Magasanikbacteria bacterium GW2011_GWC2_42_27]KKS71751.1 MAG: hypothetical protein UV42_C0020G0013 [Candidatus Magasanikbacteria bacterium GW2011_GWE2_42_7]KKT03774.1 MAG: hypothetical protein UV82_C0016G0028 [Candidatus Magasanikbacteria bacterium GW2011_GWD2_43_18]KKT25480.1 MAG: hypothetical protein UW10_C0007G0053 [Candidatus Magasanikbacteria bacterium GW2011_GWA2_43_9]HBB38423.1 hypothetical protein [Candidatus Magasanikbacteria bac
MVRQELTPEMRAVWNAKIGLPEEPEADPMQEIGETDQEEQVTNEIYRYYQFSGDRANHGKHEYAMREIEGKLGLPKGTIDGSTMDAINHELGQITVELTAFLRQQSSQSPNLHAKRGKNLVLHQAYELFGHVPEDVLEAIADDVAEAVCGFSM